MIAIYRKDGYFGFIFARGYCNYCGVDYKNLLLKENLPIARDERGFVFVANSCGIAFDIVAHNLDKLDPITDTCSVLHNVNVILDLLEENCQIEDGTMQNTFFIGNNTDGYVINPNFTVYKLRYPVAIGKYLGQYDAFNEFFTFEDGTEEEKIVNLLKKSSKYENGNESELVLFNSKNDEIKII